ncbi:macrolide ABC transporter ATP-binding protein/permease MacB [Chromobacterium haemolyticum]|uniref:macrolide ABC transporter ATP-binding protein/permease MacB n=1 Tax=Chromobacterium haemolyticum TaxID=394935 RepID=UPI0009DA30DB|nr:macrolide ABC transporter ATP-binding protein/permease MacB [Chromobacterium haemolyticum]OQS31088.1 macrolide ABC transporter permease/ATP-binding protein MacB [Chromobacterium haemolyticum]OQS44398.1 macrolide ABC transporter permease/ATP-binding protein MacB [Chromobacterium haemolyticum]
MSGASLTLSGVWRRFPSGDEEVAVLKEVSLDIRAGEMVAIIGASGSGKSTLMNILGCLDQPSAGRYQVGGRDVGALDKDQLATLRREHFGFIFQRYHLLPHLSAIDNVAMPAVYAGMSQEARRERARQLLERLGLAGKEDYRPGQLSGGQQQRVSIARALMNGGDIILADEPTGALDSHSGEEVMNILKELHAAGHTIIIVTHDPSIAAQTERIIEIRDGEILRDSAADAPRPAADVREPRRPKPGPAWRERMSEAFKMAMLAMLANRLRTVLTMLGIIIGITSVVSIIAVGEGARNYVLNDIRSIGTNTITVYRGKDWGDDKADGVRTFLPGDLAALSEEPYVDSVSPVTTNSLRIRYRNVDVNASVSGVDSAFFRVRGMKMAAGLGFSRDDVRMQRQVVVIDNNTRRKLFADAEAIGQVVLVGSVPATVIGVVETKENGYGGKSLQMWMPYSTAGSRLFGQAYFDYMVVRIKEGQPTALAEKALSHLLTLRHGSKDFFTYNMDEVLKTVENTSRTLALLLTLIAVISLVVGGIGVMNIMLVSVTERTREIGIRMAVGARQSDVLQQFLTEAVLVCLVGGAIGIGLSYGISFVFALLVSKWKMALSLKAIVMAVACSTAIGVVFGYLPARSAARLNPIDALARE